MGCVAPTHRAPGLKAGFTSVAPKWTNKWSKCAKIDQKTTSAPEPPSPQKRGSQARGSPCCAKMDQQMVQVRQNGPKNNKCARTPEPPPKE